MNRYDQARAWLSDRAGLAATEAARDRLRGLLRGRMTSVRTGIGDLTTEITLHREHRVIRCIATVEPTDDGFVEEHLSVSSRHELGMEAELPSWDELIAIRAIAWSDDAEVHQVLPALTGPRAEPYISVAEVLHLRRIR